MDDGSTDGSAEILDEFQSEYDAKSCPICAAWRQAWNEGLIDLGDLPFFWRPAIRLWVWTGQLWLAKVTRRMREQFTSNERLCSVISRCPLTETVQNVTRMTLMDRRGEGVPIILEEGTKLSGVKPKYELIDDAEVKLTIYSSPGDSPKTLAEIVQNLTEAPDLIERKIKDLMRANPQITQQQIAGVCGVSRSLVAMTIAKLKSAGEVGRNGSDRKGTWSVYR